MEEIPKKMPIVISEEFTQTENECEVNVAENGLNTSKTASNLLNLLAEVVVENMVKKIRNGCNRVHKDK